MAEWRPEDEVRAEWGDDTQIWGPFKSSQLVTHDEGTWLCPEGHLMRIVEEMRHDPKEGRLTLQWVPQYVRVVALPGPMNPRHHQRGPHYEAVKAAQAEAAADDRTDRLIAALEKLAGQRTSVPTDPDEVAVQARQLIEMAPTEIDDTIAQVEALTVEEEDADQEEGVPV